MGFNIDMGENIFSSDNGTSSSPSLVDSYLDGESLSNGGSLVDSYSSSGMNPDSEASIFDVAPSGHNAEEERSVAVGSSLDPDQGLVGTYAQMNSVVKTHLRNSLAKTDSQNLDINMLDTVFSDENSPVDEIIGRRLDPISKAKIDYQLNSNMQIINQIYMDSRTGYKNGNAGGNDFEGRDYTKDNHWEDISGMDGTDWSEDDGSWTNQSKSKTKDYGSFADNNDDVDIVTPSKEDAPVESGIDITEEQEGKDWIKDSGSFADNNDDVDIVTPSKEDAPVELRKENTPVESGIDITENYGSFADNNDATNIVTPSKEDAPVESSKENTSTETSKENISTKSGIDITEEQEDWKNKESWMVQESFGNNSASIGSVAVQFEKAMRNKKIVVDGESVAEQFSKEMDKRKIIIKPTSVAEEFAKFIDKSRVLQVKKRDIVGNEDTQGGVSEIIARSEVEASHEEDDTDIHDLQEESIIKHQNKAQDDPFIRLQTILRGKSDSELEDMLTIYKHKLDNDETPNEIKFKIVQMISSINSVKSSRVKTRP